jgi:CheY-like chemotaxis protein
MSTNSAVEAAIEREKLFEAFENLMPFRVQDILLVSSLYDSFILREDGRLNELLIGESYELNLQHVPRITHVRTGAEALALARSDSRFNLIVSNLEVEDMTAAEIATEVQRAGLDVPVVVLAYDYREVKNFVARTPHSPIERIFLWQGNARILISIIKYIEDNRNVEHDTEVMGVPVMLVVEDNIRYYSSFLPVIYTELISQARRLISEGLNVAHKLVRMRARPKILLASNYEDAARLVLLYRENLLGVVADVEFPRHDKLMPEAGFDLARMIRSIVPDVPIVLQSGRTEFMRRAYEEEFSFLQKRSPTLLGDLRDWLIEQVGFGDFVFRLPDRKTEVARASNLNELEKALRTVPAESISFHAGRNHFSHWLMARTEFAIAQKLRPRKLSDFATIEVLRRDLIDAITNYRRDQTQTLVGDFNPETFQPADEFFLRIGDGSLGGKARGLAFARHLRSSFAATFRGPLRCRTVVSQPMCSTASSANELHEFPGAPATARLLSAFRAAAHRRTLPAVSSWRIFAFGAPYAPPCGWRIRITSHSRVYMTLSCWAITTATTKCGCVNSPRPSSGCMRPLSASMPRLTCGRRRTAWKKRRWQYSSNRWWAWRTASDSIPTSQEWFARATSILSSQWR